MIRKIALLLAFVTANANAQLAWPSVNWNSAQNLTGLMNANGITDLSGVHWNPLNNALYCVQGDGRLRVLQMNGSATTFEQIANKALSGGPEGITTVGSALEFYTIDENSYEIRKYTHNATFGNLTEAKHWDLLQSPSPMEDTGNSGPEGITFVPDSFLVAAGFVSQATGQLYTSVKGMDGLMFIAHQDEGYIWVFDINPNVTNDFAYVGKYKTGRLESCDLDFDTSTGLLYILHNVDANYLEVATLSSTVVSGATRKFNTYKEYFIGNPSGGNINIEGFAVMPKCHGDMVWLCRDVESDEGSSNLQDALRWFDPFATDGTCGELSVGEVSQSQLKVFPNPGNNRITVSTGNDREHAKLAITNLLGQIVLEKYFTGNELSVDISALQNGLYVIQIGQGEKLQQVKWLKE